MIFIKWTVAFAITPGMIMESATSFFIWKVLLARQIKQRALKYELQL